MTSSRSVSRIVPPQSGQSLILGMILDADAVGRRMKLSSLLCLDNQWVASYR
jgi:hypothetical protein